MSNSSSIRDLVGFAHGEPPRLGALAAEGLAQHIVDIDHADMRAGHAGDFEAGHAAARVGDLDLDLLVVEFAVAEALAEGVLGGGAGTRADQRVQDALLGLEMRLGADLLALARAHEADARLHEIADDLVHVAADIADLGELGRFHLKEGRVGELGEAAGNLGLADAGRADHEDVLGQNLLAHDLVELLAAPAVAQRDGHRAFGVRLAYDVAVKLGDDFPRGEVCHAVIPSYEIRLNALRKSPLTLSFSPRGEGDPRTIRGGSSERPLSPWGERQSEGVFCGSDAKHSRGFCVSRASRFKPWMAGFR